jgi:HNH endonuclease/NUMOD4 motif
MYRAIPGFPRYRVNERGRVVSYARGKRRRLRPFTLSAGYLAVDLTHAGEKRKLYVHQLVLLAFVGPCPDGMETRHLDGNPANNRLENIRYGTPAENAQDRERHGRVASGSANGNAKLDESAAREALWLFENVTQNRAEIARRLNVGREAVRRLLSGETWAALAA